MACKSFGGSKYDITMFEDAAAVSMVRLQKKKVDAFQLFLVMINYYICLTMFSKNDERVRMGNGVEQTWTYSKTVLIIRVFSSHLILYKP